MLCYVMLCYVILCYAMIHFVFGWMFCGLSSALNFRDTLSKQTSRAEVGVCCTLLSRDSRPLGALKQ